MKLARWTFALGIAAVATACSAERAVAPKPAASSFSSVVAGATQVPLLFVVDGVRLQRDQLPALTADQVSAVHVVKGSAALREYGPEAAYGVVVITTKAPAASGRKS